MTMHPELKHALNTGVSIPEVTKILKKYHGGPMEEKTEPPYRGKATHSVHKFWDNWSPLFCRLPPFPRPQPNAIDEPFLNIHKAITRELISWLCDSKRKSNVYLIVEPWISGLDALAHTRAAVFANICSDAQRFGQIIRFTDIYSLIAGLAVFYPAYRRILARMLVDNPGIPGLPLRICIKKLIYEPWKALQESHPEYVIAPPVIFLRWDSRRQDEELFRSICEFDSLSYSSPLLWVISVKPKIKLPIHDLFDPVAPFRYTRLPICYNEAPADAALLLRVEFSTLRQKHKETFDDDELWPSEEQMSQLARIVSGVFEFVDVIIKFVDWRGDGGPRAHLETLLAYMVNSPSPSDEQPYRVLDHFYTRALSNIPPDVLSVLKKAFGIVRCLDKYLDPVELVCLLSVGNDTFLPHLQRLATIGAHEWYDICSGRCFKYFLEDSNRSGQFYTPKSESRLHAFQACLRTLSHSSSLTTILKPRAVQWIQADRNAFNKRTRRVACNGLCDILGAGEVLLLQHFDFRCLAHTCDKFGYHDFMWFLKRLYALDKGNSPNIVRTQPVGPLDRQFIDKCEGLAEPLALEGEEQFHPCPKYVLLGYETETVLAVIASREKYGESFYERSSGVNIYTPDMLDYM